MITIDELKVQLDNKSRLLGVDMGTKRVGVSISDENRKIATPLETIEFSNIKNLSSRFKELILENKIKSVEETIMILKHQEKNLLEVLTMHEYKSNERQVHEWVRELIIGSDYIIRLQKSLRLLKKTLPQRRDRGGKKD